MATSLSIEELEVYECDEQDDEDDTDDVEDAESWEILGAGLALVVVEVAMDGGSAVVDGGVGWRLS